MHVHIVNFEYTLCTHDIHCVHIAYTVGEGDSESWVVPLLCQHNEDVQVEQWLWGHVHLRLNHLWNWRQELQPLPK